MLELLRRLKPLEQDAKITEGVARLASKEREVRSLELLIEYISSIEDKELARLWPRLVTAVYSSQTPGTAARITKSAPRDDDSLALEG
jgi:hypothetical protein